MQAPVLLEDGSSLDWPNASYVPDVRIGDRFASVNHHLEGAAVLSELVAQGAARWAVELRCPKTMLARTTIGQVSQQTVRWEDSEVDGPAWLIPGLLVTGPVRLPDTGGLNELWREAQLEVPAGYWLARGDPRRVTPLTDSLLRFQRDESLAEGRMMTAPDRSSGSLRFVVRCALDVHRQVERNNRSVWLAALISVCGLFGREFRAGGDDSPGESDLADELRFRLEQADVATWDDTDRYDPAAAATALEPFIFEDEYGATDG